MPVVPCSVCKGEINTESSPSGKCVRCLNKEGHASAAPPLPLSGDEKGRARDSLAKVTPGASPPSEARKSALVEQPGASGVAPLVSPAREKTTSTGEDAAKDLESEHHKPEPEHAKEPEHKAHHLPKKHGG